MSSDMNIGAQGAAASQQFLGQYSGISSTTIDQLIQADSIPMQQMQNQVSTLQGQEQAWGDVRTSLNNFLTDVQALQNTSTYNSKVANSTNNNVATISGDTTASEGSHDIIIKQLASATSFTGGRVTAKDTNTALNLTGTLTLNLTPDDDSTQTGTDGSSIDVPGFTLPTADTTVSTTDASSKPGQVNVPIGANDTLTSIMNKVNSQTKQSDITASIVDNHLVFTSTQDGKATIDTNGSTNSVADGLALTSGTKTITGSAAIFSLDGLQIARNTNTVSDVLNGATINLVGVTPSTSTTDSTGKTTTNQTPTTLSLTNDNSKFEGAVNTMITQYNSLMSVIGNDLDAGNPSQADNQQGALVGDSSLMELQEQLQNMVTGNASSVDPKTGYNTADSIGISFVDKNGTLGLDTTKFEAALKANPQAVKNFFYKADTNVTTGIATNQAGYAYDLGKFANSYLANTTGNEGIIANINADMDSTIKDLNSQISDFQDQLTDKRAEYVTEYSALDSFMSQAQSQLTYFQQQAGAL
ncbi:flagellar filament capping protein FliD [Periweissella ghanensis]|uniref:Flagellar hook-associated protein 2 n=1 Tax=Periweissella ghanensis TaxID=467997 RepID=A0ABM8Z991_9LACO|nr:flagellar filament capping protein FliD [Periweissella ghanensis]MCM0600999.1 flagellar filament capping protein FliD [Periweissella ghanensis]CAH0417920.1 Flagellar hook-associated protein 2 [Periweissella ghanensis]